MSFKIEQCPFSTPIFYATDLVKISDKVCYSTLWVGTLFPHDVVELIHHDCIFCSLECGADQIQEVFQFLRIHTGITCEGTIVTKVLTFSDAKINQ